MKLILFLATVLSMPGGIKQDGPAFTNREIRAKYLHRTIWIDPRKNNSITIYSALKPVPVAAKAPPRFRPLVVEKIAFEESSATPVMLFCMSEGHSYIIPCTRNGIDTVVSLTAPIIGKSWGASVWNAIDHERITIDMTKAEVRLALGDPIAVNTARLHDTIMELWDYPDSSLGFVNGVVRSVEK